MSQSAIESVAVLASGETLHIGDAATGALPAQIVETQSVGVDVITGATYTSRALLGAVEDCLEQAGGREAVMAFSTPVPSQPWSTEEKSMEVDVVVVGAGLTGVSARPGPPRRAGPPWFCWRSSPSTAAPAKRRAAAF